MKSPTTKQYPKTFSFPRKLFTYYYFKNNPSSFWILLLSALEKKLKSLTTPLRSTPEPRSACHAIASGEWTRRENWIFSKRTYAAFLMYLLSPALGKYERESGPRGGKIDPKMLRWRRNFIGAALGPLTLFLCFYLSFNIVYTPTPNSIFSYMYKRALLIYLRKNIRKEKK